jgi:phosphoribosylanthranilate isomerase
LNNTNNMFKTDNKGWVPRTRVKICGITRPQDAVLAAQLGADAIGLVFYDKSPRAITVEQAQAIITQCPAFVTVVGLFVDAETPFVHRILAQVPLNVLQFHGNEPPDYCIQFGKPYIKALRVQPDTDIPAFVQRYTQANAILLDSYVKGIKGGTGITFDWQRIPACSPKPLILAGGLTPDNVAHAIMTGHPYAVDVSGGVESSKGIKDAEKMTAFMRGVFMSATKSNFDIHALPDAQGHFGRYGGRFVAETLMYPLEELNGAYARYLRDSQFLAELNDDLHHFVGRPSPLYHAVRWSEQLGGAQIYLKREDLNHTGAHKINNTVGQALLAKRMGKKTGDCGNRGRTTRGCHSHGSGSLWYAMCGLYGF